MGSVTDCFTKLAKTDINKYITTAAALTCMLTFIFSVPAAKAQSVSKRHLPALDSSYNKNQFDVGDLWHKIEGKKYTSKPDSSALQKGKIYLSFIPAVGYTVQTSFTAVATANISFYTDSPNYENISTVYASANFSLLHQIVVPVISSIWSKDNAFNFLGDYRYYKYPSVTYGLGGHSQLSSADAVSYSYFRFYQVAAREVFPDFLAGLGYNLDYRYDIKDFGTKDGTVSDFTRYGLKNTTVSSGLSLNFLYDTRRNSNNPQGGWFANLALRPNMKMLGSDDNWQSVFGEVRKYIRFPEGSHNVLALWNFDWFTFGKAPYLDLPATAWETYANSARGYVQDRFKGPDMIYFEAEYRFNLMRNGFLGGVVFANAQSVANYPERNFDAIYPAAGAGFRIKVNKHSNTNACIDYGIGLNGSRAFYLNLGEVF